MKKRNHANAGFTLIEVIISLAVLSIASVFVLQMFVTASQLNRNARNVDQANAQVSTLIEYFLLCEDPAAYAGYAHLYAPQTESAGDAITITCYFDWDWQPTTPEGEPLFAVRAAISPAEEGAVTPTSFGEGAGDEAVAGRLYALEIQVLHKTSGGQEAQLAQAGIQRYFQVKEALP